MGEGEGKARGAACLIIMNALTLTRTEAVRARDTTSNEAKLQ